MIRLTSMGKGALGLAAGLYVLGILLGYPSLIAFGTALLSPVVLALGWVVPKAQLSVWREVEPAGVERGSEARARLQVTNLGRHTIPNTQVVDRVGENDIARDLPPLVSRRPHDVVYDLPTQTRGKIHVGPLVAGRIDPLGLAVRRQQYGEDRVLWVRPRSHEMSSPLLGSVKEIEDAQVFESAIEGMSVFHGLRSYQRGDDLRMVHWLTTARTGELMVRKYVDADTPELSVFLDDRVGSHRTAEEFEEIVEVAASAALSVDPGSSVGFVLMSSINASSATHSSVDDLLNLLTVVQPAEAGTSDLATLTAQQAGHGGMAFLVASDVKRADLSELDILRRRYRRVFVLLVGANDVGSERVSGCDLYWAPTASELVAAWNDAEAR